MKSSVGPGVCMARDEGEDHRSEWTTRQPFSSPLRTSTRLTCLPGRTSELGEERGGRGARLRAPGLQGRDEVHDGGVRPC